MKRLTLEWIEKAESDFHLLEREIRARKNPSYDAVCFHAEQCAEKYLKGRLTEAKIAFPKTHDLVPFPPFGESVLTCRRFSID